MKVKVISVHGPKGTLYPRDEFTVIKAGQYQTLIETDTGARQWVGNSFLINMDGTPFDATRLSPAASSEVTEEVGECLWSEKACTCGGGACEQVDFGIGGDE